MKLNVRIIRNNHDNTPTIAPQERVGFQSNKIHCTWVSDRHYAEKQDHKMRLEDSKIDHDIGSTVKKRIEKLQTMNQV